MTEHHDHREVGTLTAADLGKQVRVEWEGWTRIGTLKSVKHDATFGGHRTLVHVTSESGSNWRKRLPIDHPITVRAEEPA